MNFPTSVHSFIWPKGLFMQWPSSHLYQHQHSAWSKLLEIRLWPVCLVTFCMDDDDPENLFANSFVSDLQGSFPVTWPTSSIRNRRTSSRVHSSLHPHLLLRLFIDAHIKLILLFIITIFSFIFILVKISFHTKSLHFTRKLISLGEVASLLCWIMHRGTMSMLDRLINSPSK